MAECVIIPGGLTDDSSVPRLCLARTLRPLPGEQPGDVDAELGEVLVVLRSVGKDYFYGYVTGSPDRAGLFSQLAVEIIQGSAVPLAPMVIPVGSSSPLPDNEDVYWTGDGFSDTQSDATGDWERDGELSDSAGTSPANNREPPPPPPRSGRPISGFPRHQPPGSNRASTRKVLSTEVVRAISIPFCERKQTLDGELHSWYTIDIATDRRIARVEKRFSEFRTADAQLRTMFPKCFADTALRDSVGMEVTDGAAVPIDVNLHEGSLMQAKRTAEVMEKRRLAAERYVKLAVMHPRLCDMVVRFLLTTPAGRAGADAGDELPGAQKKASAFARGVSNNRLSLSLAAVQDTSLPALGSAFRAELPPLQQAPGLDVITTGLAGFSESSISPAIIGVAEGEEDQVDSVVDDIPAEDTLPEVRPLVIRHVETNEGASLAFNLESLEAFDALMERGYAVLRAVEGDLQADRLTDEGVEVLGDPPQPPENPGYGFNCVSDEEMCTQAILPSAHAYPLTGQRVCVSYEALVWDGSTTTAQLYEEVEQAFFHIGDFRDDAVPKGLHDALRSVPVRSQVFIVLGPDAAYGQPGKPPHVPAAAHLVYNLKLRKISGSPRDMRAYAGKPASLEKARLGAVFPAEKKPLLDDSMMAMAASLLGTSSTSTGAGTRWMGNSAPRAPPITIGAMNDATSPPSAHHLGGFRQTQSPGAKMPTPEEAERAFRAYLASLEGNPVSSTDLPPKHNRTGSSASTGLSFVRGLFTRQSIMERPSAVESPQEDQMSPSGGKLFSRLFKRGSSHSSSDPANLALVQQGASTPASRGPSPALNDTLTKGVAER